MLSRISVPARLSLAYLFFSATWIVASTNVAEYFAKGDASLLKSIEESKGLAFVAASSVLVYFLSRNFYDRIQRMLDGYRTIIRKNQAINIASKEGIYEYDIRHDRVLFNTNIQEILGHEISSLSNGRKYWEDGIHPEHREKVLKKFDMAIKEGVNYWREEYKFLASGNQYKTILHSIYILRDKHNHPYSVIGAIQDMTEQRQLEFEFHEQERRQRKEIAQSIIEAEEKERNRWAEELHDNIAQVLSVAKLYAGTLQDPSSSLQVKSEKITEMVELAIQEIRHLSANLKPPLFQEEGLKQAIEVLIFNIRQVKKIQFKVEAADDSDRLLNDDQKLMVYRIIQEQVNNVLKYAEASSVDIGLAVSSKEAEIIVRDNGKGFDTSSVFHGTGLKNIRSRLNLFQGNMEIISSPGNGCELRARFEL